MRFLLWFFVNILLVSQTYAIFEISGQYGLDKQVYGEQRQNDISSTTIAGSLALYLYDLTAIELNYSNTETVTNDVFLGKNDDEYQITSNKSTVLVETYGIGIRQAFAGRRARFIPTLSIGYAKRFATSSSSSVLRRNSDDATAELSNGSFKIRDDSVFATLGFNIKVTRMLSFRASAQTVFKAFEFNRAQDNVKYLFGFSWYL